MLHLSLYGKTDYAGNVHLPEKRHVHMKFHQVRKEFNKITIERGVERLTTGWVAKPHSLIVGWGRFFCGEAPL